jgi:hypothetical protein
MISTSDHTHFLVKQRSGDALAMIQSSNGSFSITRNGQPVAGCRWSVRQLMAAVRYYRVLTSAKGPTLPPRKFRAPATRVPLPRTYRAALEAWDAEGGSTTHEGIQTLRRKARRRLTLAAPTPM